MIKKLLLTLLLLLTTVLIALFIQQNVRMNRELNELEEKGTRVETDYGDVHVHTKGLGEPLVFLSGLGTTSPLYDFKPLWSHLEDDYQIIILERPGYGYNDTSSSDKSLETLTAMYRDTLSQLEIDGPYTLVPHSMGGLIATYWAWEHGEEIAHIIGLDITLPPLVLEVTEPPSFIESNMQWLIGRLGVARFMEDDDLVNVLPLLDLPYFSDEEHDAIKTLFFANMFNRNIVREAGKVHDMATVMDETPRPFLTPTLLFVAQEHLDTYPEAEDIIEAYFEPFNRYESHRLDTHHYVHHEKGELIAQHMRTFIENNDE